MLAGLRPGGPPCQGEARGSERDRSRPRDRAGISSSFEEDLLTGLSGLYDNEMAHALRQIEELSPAYLQVIQALDPAHGG